MAGAGTMETDMPPPAPQAPKTNADFRRMLETPRTDRSEDGAPGGARMRRQKAGGEPGEAKKKSRRPKPVAEDGEGDAEEKYRCACRARRCVTDNEPCTCF